MWQSIQSDVTCDEKRKKKKKKKAGPKLDEDVRTDSREASEVQQQPMSNRYSLSDGVSQGRIGILMQGFPLRQNDVRLPLMIENHKAVYNV